MSGPCDEHRENVVGCAGCGAIRECDDLRAQLAAAEERARKAETIRVHLSACLVHLLESVEMTLNHQEKLGAQLDKIRVSLNAAFRLCDNAVAPDAIERGDYLTR